MKHLLIGNDKIAYNQIGDKKSKYTFVFIHGATMTGLGMLPVAKNFKQYNCIIIDLPAHGASTGNVRTTIEELADCVDLFLMELVHKKIISKHISLVGYSLGGVISLELALKKREEYKRLFIISSGASLSKYVPLVDIIKNLPIESFNINNFFEHAFGKNTTEEQKKYIVDMLMKIKVDDNIGYTDLVSATTYNKIERMSEINLPTFIFTGDEDQIILPNCEIELWNAIKNSTLVVVPFRGHTAIFEELDYLVSLINDFCKHNN